jgi:DNA segregation ATPase FtsK/SpoIIIE-like protein
MEYAISSGITMSSRVIMDKVGAEKLLGNGDMLFLSPNGINPDRDAGGDDTMRFTQLIELPYAERYIRRCEKSVVPLRGNLLLDFQNETADPGIRPVQKSTKVRPAEKITPRARHQAG